jgi:hypothetical protein
VGHTCFSVVVWILGLLHPAHICALLQILEVPHKYWLLAVEDTVLASVNAFYFLHRVHFGGLSEKVCLELVLIMQGWKLILLTPLIWMNHWHGWSGVDASVDHLGVTVLVQHPSKDPSD